MPRRPSDAQMAEWRKVDSKQWSQPKTQCAWCLRYTQDGKAVGYAAPSKDLDASHGICTECLDKVLQDAR